jgi:hypothetical protein
MADNPLVSTPNTDAGRPRHGPPWRIGLRPWATEVAEELHRHFGDDVDLFVGQFSYPEKRPRRPRPIKHPESIDADPNEMSVELEAPLVVRSGHSVTGHVLIRNRASDELAIESGGGLFGEVLDPATGDIVGGYRGWVAAPLVTWKLASGESKRVRMHVGTASDRPELGYAIPPGEWAVRAVLKLGDGRRVRTPMWSLRVER